MVNVHMSCLKSELSRGKVYVTDLLVLDIWMICKKCPMLWLDSPGYKKQRLQQFPQIMRETIQRETKETKTKPNQNKQTNKNKEKPKPNSP